MSLKVYNRKRKFDQTPEPKGKKGKSAKNLRFVVQLHRATRLHFDFRLEFDGVFKSWAVPKGPSLNPQDQRLAVFVEDHPLDYGSFEGIIPKGNYGAGTVMIWDEGTYIERGSKARDDSEEAMIKNFKKGHMTFILKGHKLNGEFALIKLKKDDPKTWLLVKKRDVFAINKKMLEDNLSVKSGRSLDEIADESENKGDVWLPKRHKISKKVTPDKNLSPMPRKNKPMLATASLKKVDGKDWIFEPKLDGLRAIAEVEGKRIHLYSKSLLPFEKKFPKIVEELKTLAKPMVLDGEILDNTYHIYDILYCDGKDLRKEPLKVRKKILKDTLKEGNFLKLVKEGSGNIAKNLLSTYHEGTSSEWLIIQNLEKNLGDDGPKLTNLDKIYFPDDQITKGDVIEYYRKISHLILPYLIDRPESLNRLPNGIAAKGFYQKDMIGHLPRFIKTKRIFSESANKTVDYILCQDEKSLLYIVNLGCIEIHPWFSRVESLENPDYMIIDLDPDGNDFNHVIEIALLFHKILDDIGAANFCKTSGATGIHIGVPCGAKYTYDEVREFAESICNYVANKFPDTTSIERNPKRRNGKIYLDFLQNRRGQTLAAPFCIRPHPGAPVSMPLKWDELRKGLKPKLFNMHNVFRLMKDKEDPWKGVLGKSIDLKLSAKKFRQKYT